MAPPRHISSVSAARLCDAGRGVLVRDVTASTLVAEVKLRADGCEEHALVFAGRRLDDGRTVSLPPQLGPRAACRF